MTYELPPEPEVDKLIDKNGVIWARGKVYWHSLSGSLRNWPELLHYNSPLEDYKPKYNVVSQKNNGLVSSPGDTSIYDRELTKEQAQRIINGFIGITSPSLILKFERDVMFQRKYDGYAWTYTIEEA